MPSPSGSKSPTAVGNEWLLDPEDEGTIILWNPGNFSPAKTAQEHREQEHSCFRFLSTLYIGIHLSFLLYSHIYCLITVITVEPTASQVFLQQPKICSCTHTVLTSLTDILGWPMWSLSWMSVQPFSDMLRSHYAITIPFNQTAAKYQCRKHMSPTNENNTVYFTRSSVQHFCHCPHLISQITIHLLLYHLVFPHWRYHKLHFRFPP